LRVTVDLVRELGLRVIDRQELERAPTLIESHPDDVTLMIPTGSMPGVYGQELAHAAWP